MRGSASQACKSRCVSAVFLQKALGDTEVPPPPEVLGVVWTILMVLTSRCDTHWSSVTWSHGLHSWAQTPFTRTVAIMDEGSPPSHDFI